MTAADETATELAKISTSDASIIGVFKELDGSLAVVVVGAEQLRVPNIGDTVPYPGQQVRLITIGKQTFLWGPASPGWPIGQVVAFAAPIATVECPPGSGATFKLGCWTGASLAPGDYVLVDWRAPLVAQGPYSVDALPVNVAPDSPDGGASGPHRLTFFATDTGSRNGSSWWTNEVWDSDNNDSAAFYGSQIKDTIPDSAVITAMSVYLPAKSTSGFAPQLRAIAEGAGKPGGGVTFVGPTFALPSRSGWVSIPTTFGDLMKVASYGLGFAAGTGGFNIWKGTQADGQAFALDISWEA